MRKPLEIVINEYQRSLYTVAFSICQSSEDANDVVQDTFIQYFRTGTEYKDEEHLKAWLLRVAINRAKNLKKSFWHRRTVALEETGTEISFNRPEDSGIFEALMKLPEKYRIAIHLYYYEDYSVKEISDLLNISESNAKKRLSRGRQMLRAILGREAR